MQYRESCPKREVHSYIGLPQETKYNKPVNIARKKETHRYRENANGYQWGEARRGIIGMTEWGDTNYWV